MRVRDWSSRDSISGVMTSRCWIIGMNCSHFFSRFQVMAERLWLRKIVDMNITWASLVWKRPLVSNNILSTISWPPSQERICLVSLLGQHRYRSNDVNLTKVVEQDVGRVLRARRRKGTCSWCSCCYYLWRQSFPRRLPERSANCKSLWSSYGNARHRCHRSTFRLWQSFVRSPRFNR